MKATGDVLHLQRDVLSEGDVSGHGEVVELQHVRDVLEPGQILLNLQNKQQQQTLCVFSLFLCDRKKTR